MSASRHTFPRRLRLTHDREYQAVFDARVRHAVHPVTVYGAPNERLHSRLGLSVSRKVNTAVKRNRIKRLLREAFRLMQHDFPAPYDLVAVARPHEPRTLDWYQQALRECVNSIDREWKKGGKTPARTANRGEPGRPRAS